MMERPSSLDVLHQMRHVGAPVTSAEAEHERRERISARIVELQEEFEQRSSARHRIKKIAVVAGPLLVAASYLLWLRFGQSEAEDVVARGDESSASIQLSQPAAQVTEAVQPLEFEPAREIIVEKSAAELRMPSSAALKATPGSRFRVDRQPLGDDRWREYVYVHSGMLDVDIPRLDQRKELVVHTKTATIDVHSKRFSIDVPENSTRGTQVRVMEGKLFVRTSAGVRVVTAGQIWQSDDNMENSSPTPERGQHAQPDAAGSRRATAQPSAGNSPAVPDEPSEVPSSLQEANRLMQAALLAKTGGMKDLALQRFVELIRRFPQTEPAATARAERFRLLSQMGRGSAARRAARQYLAAHPNGFAHSEARALLDAEH